MDNEVFDMGVMFAFGIIGYLMRKLDSPAAPVLLGLDYGAGQGGGEGCHRRRYGYHADRHVGPGPRCVWHVHIGIGTSANLGGTIKAAYHFDGMMYNPTLKLDGRVVLEGGELRI
jgi:hypothetical protein